MGYWLVKSDPDEFGIDDLAAIHDQTEHWDGVRNYQARNMLRDQMKCGDQVFFYHSNTKIPGIVGIAKVVREGHADFTAFDPNHPHYDPKSDLDKPRWYMVDLRLERKLSRMITLAELKQYPELKELALLRRGSRLSVMPLSAAQWHFVLELE